MLKGAIHLHTTYSDGERSLAELVALFRDSGCSFACVTDHADYFDARRAQEYVDECRSLSSPDFVVIPGLEFSCDRRMHVLGVGVTELCPSVDPQLVFAHIASHGGVSVIAHPADAAFPWIDSFERLPDAIEAWNTKYDGRYGPRARTFDLLAQLQQRKPELLAFYGQDLHWRRQFNGMYTFVHTSELSLAAILSALRDGRYHAEKEQVTLPASGNIDRGLLERLDRAQSRWMRLRRFLMSAYRMTGRARSMLPASIKAHLRRVI